MLIIPFNIHSSFRKCVLVSCVFGNRGMKMYLYTCISMPLKESGIGKMTCPKGLCRFRVRRSGIRISGPDSPNSCQIHSNYHSSKRAASICMESTKNAQFTLSENQASCCVVRRQLESAVCKQLHVYLREQ